MDFTHVLPWLVVQHFPGMGPVTWRKLPDKYRQPLSFLHSDPEDWGVEVETELCQALLRWQKNPRCCPVQQKAQRELDFLVAEGIEVIPQGAPAYPALLYEIYDPPLLLYAHGNTELLKKPQLAVVGSRKMTASGRRATRELVQQAVRSGFTITSGMALGVDGEAHRTALAEAGNTVAVLGTGIDVYYPKRHAHLAREIIQAGVIISEFSPGTQAHRGCFPRRNRIISGLSQGVLVVEAGLPSGSLITARTALEQGREVFAVPGSIYSTNSRGCHYLIRDGAKLVECFSDIAEELRGFGSVKSQGLAGQKDDIATLDNRERQLFALIGFEAISIDQLVCESGWDVATVTAVLTSLEMCGIVQNCAAGYIRI